MKIFARMRPSRAAAATRLDSGGIRPGLRARLGLQGGSRVRWSAGVFYLPRFMPTSVAEGGGADGQVLFKVARTGGEDGAITLGPRLSIEAVDWEPSSPSVALVQLAFVLRWTAFDTTQRAWQF